MPLIKRFYTDRYLQIRSFCLSALVAFALAFAVYSVQSPEFYRFEPQLWHMLFIPLGIYVGGLSAVFMHNASHGSFPNPRLNEACGQLAGVHQLWGFTGWKLIHLLHHMYSDRADWDTHPPKGLTFWQFTRGMFVYSSRSISKRYREHWGNTRRTQFLQLAGLIAFFLMAAANMVLLAALLGPVGMVFFFVPSYVANHLLYAHINYRAHPENEQGETAPVNLNHNAYYKIANALWFGIYFHGNHHRRPQLFNPRHMQVKQRDAATEMRSAA